MMKEVIRGNYRSEFMTLENASICLDCNALFEPGKYGEECFSSCPACGSRTYELVTRWIQPLESIGKPVETTVEDETIKIIDEQPPRRSLRGRQVCQD